MGVGPMEYQMTDEQVAAFHKAIPRCLGAALAMEPPVRPCGVPLVPLGRSGLLCPKCHWIELPYPDLFYREAKKSHPRRNDTGAQVRNALG